MPAAPGDVSLFAPSHSSPARYKDGKPVPNDSKTLPFQLDMETGNLY